MAAVLEGLAARPVHLGYVQTSLAKFDRFYDPNGDGVLSLEEMKAFKNTGLRKGYAYALSDQGWSYT